MNKRVPFNAPDAQDGLQAKKACQCTAAASKIPADQMKSETDTFSLSLSLSLLRSPTFVGPGDHVTVPKQQDRQVTICFMYPISGHCTNQSHQKHGSV